MEHAENRDFKEVKEPPAFRVMISHATVDEPLAAAWDSLLTTVFPGAITWFSTKREAFRPEDNRGFAEKIEAEIRSADFLLTIQTPNSRLRPWLVWEAGLAVGAKVRTFVVLYSIQPGETGTPLDGMNQHSQNRDEGGRNGWIEARKNVEDIISSVASIKNIGSNPGVVRPAIESYLKSVEAHSPLLDHEDVSYDKRIRIKLSKDDVTSLRSEFKLSDNVQIAGVNSSLAIFGFPAAVTLTTWGELLKMLENLRGGIPWPQSANRWASALGRFLANILNSRIDPSKHAEALPLYLDYNQLKGVGDSYRPAVSRKLVEAGRVEFEITFVQLPPEYVTFSRGRANDLFQYISFCRMIRYGILEADRFRPLFEGKLPKGSVQAEVQAFADALMNIRIEFQNRGLQKGKLLDSLPTDMRRRAEKLQDRWFATVEPLEPERNPTSDIIKESYPKLLEINKKYFGCVNSAMRNEIRGLSTR